MLHPEVTISFVVVVVAAAVVDVQLEHAEELNAEVSALNQELLLGDCSGSFLL